MSFERARVERVSFSIWLQTPAVIGLEDRIHISQIRSFSQLAHCLLLGSFGIGRSVFRPFGFWCLLFGVVRILRTSSLIMAGRQGPRRTSAEEDMPYEECELPIDEGRFYQGPLLVGYGAEELYVQHHRPFGGRSCLVSNFKPCSIGAWLSWSCSFFA